LFSTVYILILLVFPNQIQGDKCQLNLLLTSAIGNLFNDISTCAADTGYDLMTVIADDVIPPTSEQMNLIHSNANCINTVKQLFESAPLCDVSNGTSLIPLKVAMERIINYQSSREVDATTFEAISNAPSTPIVTEAPRVVEQPPVLSVVEKPANHEKPAEPKVNGSSSVSSLSGSRSSSASFSDEITSNQRSNIEFSSTLDDSADSRSDSMYEPEEIKTPRPKSSSSQMNINAVFMISMSVLCIVFSSIVH
jgi:hypothetical protein